MRNRFALVSLSALAFLASCKQDTANAGTSALATEATTAATKITDLLTGVKDADGAKKASEQIGSLTTGLSGILDKIKAAAGAAAGDAGKAGGDLKGMAGEAAKKLGGMLSPELTGAFTKITEQITRISANADMLAPLKDTFEKLKGLMPKAN